MRSAISTAIARWPPTKIPYTKSPSLATTPRSATKKTIRVTDMAFDEDVLLDQDRSPPAAPQRPEVREEDDGHRAALYFWAASMRSRSAAQASTPGCCAAAARLAIPIFVGAPGDGSVFLNSMKLWAMREAGIIPQYGFDLDLHAEVFESCAYHRWGLFEESRRVAGDAGPRRRRFQATSTCNRSPRSARSSASPTCAATNLDVQIVSVPGHGLARSPLAFRRRP